MPYRDSRNAHPSVFLFLILPFGAMSGYLTVASRTSFSGRGRRRRVAELVAVSFIPQTWKFLWAPIADTTLARKRWYMLAGVVSAVGIFVTGAIPAERRGNGPLYVVVLLSNLAVTFLAMASESLMVYGDAPDRMRRARGVVPGRQSRRQRVSEGAWACGWRRRCPRRG